MQIEDLWRAGERAPFAAMPRWAVAVAVPAAVALACALAAWTIRRGGHVCWVTRSFAVPLALAFALWHGAPWVLDGSAWLVGLPADFREGTEP